MCSRAGANATFTFNGTGVWYDTYPIDSCYFVLIFILLSGFSVPFAETM
jgi:hypothetical protein